jgi:hypothetical protein
MKQSSEVTEEKFRPFLTQMLEISICELHSDSLWVGPSGDRITVGASFFVPVQIGPGAHPAPYTMGTMSLSWG